MAVGIGAINEHGIGQLMVTDKQVKPVEELCYLGSILTNNGSCQKELLKLRRTARNVKAN